MKIVAPPLLKLASALASALLFLVDRRYFASAVLYGDEIYQDVAGGRFWAFYSEGVGIVNPETCELEFEITADHEGNALPAAWNDVVYMQHDTGDGNLKGYMMAGSRVDYSNELGEPVSNIYAISTTDRQVVDTVQVGPRGVHTYGVWPHNEFWSHSDGDGHFYVIHLSDLSTAKHKVSAKSVDPFHGKLLWDEDPATLDHRGFATSTGERFLFEINLDTKVQTAKYDYTNDLLPDSGCKGLHAIAYSAKNEHIYAECSGGGGILEFDVSNDGMAFVHQHLNTDGAIYETPNGEFVVASNKEANLIHIFTPQGSGQQSSLDTNIEVPGHPSSVSFLPNGGDGVLDFIACTPLTENLNTNHWRDGDVVCDRYVGCSGAVTADDAAHGICLHNSDNMTLARVTQEMNASQIPAACTRCLEASNFVDDGECVCTPHCGSCDPAPVFDDSQSGYMCIDLADAVAGINTLPTLIPNTGGMKQGNPYGGSADCSFGGTYRNHKRGGIYDAAVATAPENSIQIINMQTMTKQCTVTLPGEPRKVAYAPLSPVQVNPGPPVDHTGHDHGHGDGDMKNSNDSMGESGADSVETSASAMKSIVGSFVTVFGVCVASLWVQV